MKFTLLLVLIATVCAAEIDFCPEREQIVPCSCSTFTGVEFHCHGPSITLQSIENVFNVIRSYDPNPIVKSFYLFDTELTSFTLTPFSNISFDYVHFQNNVNLTSIWWTTPDPLQFSVTSLRLSNSPLLINNGFSSRLSPSSLKNFYMMLTSISGGTSDFLPGLSSQTQLEILQLESSRINTTRIGRGLFNKFPRIRTLTLSRIGIEEIGAGAFDFDEYPADYTSALHLGLKNNQLTDVKISAEHGLDKITSRGVILYLENNQLETLSREKFEPFLRSGVNQLRVAGNVIVCDEKVKWLKDGRQQYQIKVIGPDCVNDPGKTVFTSDLIQ